MVETTVLQKQQSGHVGGGTWNGFTTLHQVGVSR